ncbi:hypothetical protein GCM10010483_62820 [Actinokineospora diospyrosa]
MNGCPDTKKFAASAPWAIATPSAAATAAAGSATAVLRPQRVPDRGPAAAARIRSFQPRTADRRCWGWAIGAPDCGGWPWPKTRADLRGNASAPVVGTPWQTPGGSDKGPFALQRDLGSLLLRRNSYGA